MDTIQKVLVKMGRKDLAQEYYLKVATNLGTKYDRTKVNNEKVAMKKAQQAAKKFMKMLEYPSDLSKQDEVQKFVWALKEGEWLESEDGDFVWLTNSLANKIKGELKRRWNIDLINKPYSDY